MFKKILSVSLCMLLSFLCSFSCVSAKSCECSKTNDSSDVIVVHVDEQNIEFSKEKIEKICKKQIKKLESEKNSKSSFQRWTNVLNHPFRIILRAGVWGIIGGILGCLLFQSNTVGVIAALCAVCGGATKVIDYYNE